jgi:hypothetical protein
MLLMKISVVACKTSCAKSSSIVTYNKSKVDVKTIEAVINI